MMLTVPRVTPFCPVLCLLVLTLLSPVKVNGQQLTPDPSRIDFGNVQLGTSSQGETLTNRGGSIVTITSYSINGTGFSLTGLTLPKTLNAHGDVSFTVTFSPTVVGTVSGSLTITYNGTKLSIPLSGTGITQGSLSADPASVSFGNIQGEANPQEVTLSNKGGTPVMISADTISGRGFSLDGLAVPETVSPGASTSFTVGFDPSGIGPSSGSITLTSNGSNPTLTIPLSATVTQGNLTPDSASISFGEIVVKTSNTAVKANSSNQTENLVNTSQADITIKNVSVSGSGFSLTAGPKYPLTLKKGGSAAFTVTFNPTSVGFASGSLAITSSDNNLSIPLFGTGVFDAGQMRDLPECSLAKTNRTCKLMIDRSNPLSPSTVQMYSSQALVVLLENPNPHERYFLDYQSGQVSLLPDVASSIVQGLLPSFAKAGEFHNAIAFIGKTSTVDPCADPAITATTAPDSGTIASQVTKFQNCFATLAQNSIDIYQDLEILVAPDSHTPPGTPTGSGDIDDIQADITKFLAQENAISGRITYISNTNKATDAVAIQQLSALQKLADAVASDLLGYSQRLSDLDEFDNRSRPCIDINKKEKDPSVRCVSIAISPDNERAYDNMVTRTITYSLNALNMVVSSQEAVPDPTKKRLLASIPVNFADSPSKPTSLRLEASAGTFFSTLPIRSFSVAPVFSGGTIINNVVAQNVLHPTVVPFAAANYRISNDLPHIRWRSAIYLTGAVGINPNTVSADFAAGLSMSWRGLMFSPLWHYGHDVRLTQGLYVGELLGAGFKGSLSTENYWKSCFAIGVSIRVPALAGR
jgi:hypothetical protein